MSSLEIVQAAAAGNINEFQSHTETEVLSRLRDRIETYKSEIASSYSDQIDESISYQSNRNIVVGHEMINGVEFNFQIERDDEEYYAVIGIGDPDDENTEDLFTSDKGKIIEFFKKHKIKANIKPLLDKIK